MKLPNLEQLSTRRKRVLRRLEKSVASYEAVGTRPVHRVGKPRLMCCGIQTEPLDFCACCKRSVLEINKTTIVICVQNIFSISCFCFPTVYYLFFYPLK